MAVAVVVVVLSVLFSANLLLPTLLEVVVVVVVDLKAIIGEIGGGTCLPTKILKQLIKGIRVTF